GHYFLAFRTLHIVSVVVLMFAFVRLTRVENMLSLCAALVAMAALMGMPAFHDTMNETELNTKLTLAAIALVVVNLSAGSERTRPTQVGRILSDAATLVLLVWALLTNELGLLHWVRWELRYEDQIFLLSSAVVAANAVISFPYVKDVIMNIASIFYCLALCMTLRELMAMIDGRRMALERAALACALLMLISIGWTIRAASFYADMRLRAYKAQVDWVFVDQ